MTETYDVVIIGGGAAGLTAGMYVARDRYRTLLCEQVAPGGQVLNCEHIENYPGFPEGIAGYTLGPRVQQQAMACGLMVRLMDVTAVRCEGDLHVVQTGIGDVYTRVLILATGSRITPLDVPGETTFFGRGVSQCATCDGAMFSGQPVAVIGGGDAALDEAVVLAQYASQVTIVHRRETLRACRLLQERAQATPNLTFRWNTVATHTPKCRDPEAELAGIASLRR